MPTFAAADIVPESFPTVAAALWQPERRLMLAVLEDAIDTYVKHVTSPRGIGRARYNEVANWFRSEDSEWPFSFVSICETLGLEPPVVRRMLVRRARSQVRGASGNPSGWGGSVLTGGVTPGGSTYTRPSGSTCSWNSGVPSFDQRASSRGGNLTM